MPFKCVRRRRHPRDVRVVSITDTGKLQAPRDHGRTPLLALRREAVRYKSILGVNSTSALYPYGIGASHKTQTGHTLVFEKTVSATSRNANRYFSRLAIILSVGPAQDNATASRPIIAPMA